jgi:chemotaxis protein methyltransferase CheR
VTISVTAEDLERARVVIARRFGLHLDDGRLRDLDDALRERVRASGADSSERYFEVLASPVAGAEELRTLAAMVTVGETYFFRNTAQCLAFSDAVLPERMRDMGHGERVRILSAGCASGEEPYTLAIFARERFGTDEPRVEILGVDVNASLIGKARRARYTPWSLRQAPPGHERYFRPVGRELQLDESIRALVSFEERNLVEDDVAFWRPERFDVIFFRNVAIYLEPDATRAVVARCARALRRGGYLFLGDAETLRGISNDFHLRHTHDAFYYQRREATDVASGVIRGGLGRPARPETPVPMDLSDSWVDAIHHSFERIADLARHSTESAAPKLPARDAELDPDVQLLEAVALTNRGLVPEAEQACERLLAKDELDAGAHYLEALCREHAGDRAGAIEHDQTAIYLDPSFAMPHLHVGLMAKRDGAPDRAGRAIARALDLFAREDSSRILIFGGGFNRDALVLLCQAELAALGGAT